MKEREILSTLARTVWVTVERASGRFIDSDGTSQRWESIVAHSSCRRFRREYHMRGELEEFSFSLLLRPPLDQDDADEYPSLRALLESGTPIPTIEDPPEEVPDTKDPAGNDTMSKPEQLEFDLS